MGHGFYFLTSGTSSKAVNETHIIYRRVVLVRLNSTGMEGALTNKTIVCRDESFFFPLQVLTWDKQPN